MHMYGGIAVMVSSYWHSWTKISETNRLFRLMANIDADIQQILSDVMKVNQLKHDIYRFELLLMAGIGVILFGSVIYDVIVFREYDFFELLFIIFSIKCIHTSTFPIPNSYSGDIVFAYYYAYIGPHFVAAIITSQFIYLVKLVQLRFSVLNQ